MDTSIKSVIIQKEKILVQFAAAQGFRLAQVNGQRILGPPFYWRGPKPPRGSEIFITNLPRDYFEFDFYHFFAAVGPIYEIRLMMDFSGFNRGFCFITYVNPELAKRAVCNLRMLEVRRRHFLRVHMSIDNDRLFVSNIPQNISDKDVVTVLTNNFGCVTKIILPKYPFTNLNRGYAFIQFSTHLNAMAARKYAYPDRLFLWGRRLFVDWAIPKCYSLKRKNQVFIGNLNKNTSKKKLISEIIQLTKENKIVSLRKEKHFAIVTFVCHASALRAINVLKGLILDDNVLYVDWKKDNHNLGMAGLKMAAN